MPGAWSLRWAFSISGDHNKKMPLKRGRKGAKNIHNYIFSYFIIPELLL